MDVDEIMNAWVREHLPKEQADQVIAEVNVRRSAAIRARFERAEKRSGIAFRNFLNGWQKMTADELEDDLRALIDRSDFPDVEIDGSEGKIPVIFQAATWSLFFFPQTVPVRIERTGELPDRADARWSPLWDHLARLGTSREDVKPLSRLGYRLFWGDCDPPVSPEVTAGWSYDVIDETA